MTDTTTDTGATEAERRELAHHPEALPMLPGELRPHPTPRQYVLIAVILVVITAIEVAISYIPSDDIGTNPIIVVLLLLAATKFFLVASWFMHLRTDKRMFSHIFTLAMVAAGVLYFVVLVSLYAFISLRS